MNNKKFFLNKFHTINYISNLIDLDEVLCELPPFNNQLEPKF